jgi:phosphatidylglycerophosphate synthase
MLRISLSLTGTAERRMLDWLCTRTPGWISSDMLTLLGLFGAALSLFGYWESAAHRAWLWLAVLGLVLNWLGDSLDGSLARFRRAERPKFGFLVDHMTDNFAMALIAVGIGLSPYALFASGIVALAAYYMMVILSMAECIATGVFRISFGGVGPTEIRLLIATCTVAGVFLPTPGLALNGTWITIYDMLIYAVTLVMVVTCLLQTSSILKQLSRDTAPETPSERR